MLFKKTRREGFSETDENKKDMKRLFIVSICCMIGLLYVSAQKSTLSSEELKFHNGIEQFLKEEGFVPTMDDDDNSINFKKEGARYWITVKGDDPFYIRFHTRGYDTEGSDRKLILEACNYANMNQRCGKACYDDDSVSFTVEYYCHSLEGFRTTFYKNMRSLDYTREAVSDYYNEHK